MASAHAVNKSFFMARIYSTNEASGQSAIELHPVVPQVTAEIRAKVPCVIE